MPKRKKKPSMVQIEIERLTEARDFDHPIYIKLVSGRFVKVAESIEALSWDTIETYRKKGVKRLYIRKVDFDDHFAPNEPLEIDLSRAEKIRELAEGAEAAIEQLFFFPGLEPEAMESAKFFTTSCVDAVTEDTALIELLWALHSQTDTVYRHSVGVGFVSVLLARVAAVGDQMSPHILGFGGLLHDIGKKEIPREILMKPRDSLSEAESRLLRSHPVRGAAILNSIKTVPLEVVKIAMQHHEKTSGAGYPGGLQLEQTDPQARLVAVANVFCNLALGLEAGSKIDPAPIVKKMRSLFGGELDSGFLGALAKAARVR